MLDVSKKQIKKLVWSIVISIACVLTVIPNNITYASPNISSPVGVVNYDLIIQQYPDTAQALETMKAVVAQARSDFETKSANMNNQDKQAYYQQLEQGLQQKHQELQKAITDKINAAVKIVADAKGLTIVVGSNATVYGGQDITDDVLKQIKGK